MSRRRKRTPIRAAWMLLRPVLIVGAILAAILGVADAAIFILVDFDSYKPRIASAIKSATGRDLNIGGHIGVSLGLTPTVTLRDVTLASVPGTDKPYLLSVDRMEFHIDLWSLLGSRIAIERLVLVHPDVALETSASGEGNWRMSPIAAKTGAPPPPDPPPSNAASSDATSPDAALPVAGLLQGKDRGRFALGAVHIEQLQLSWRDARSGRVSAWDASRLDARAEDVGGSMLLSGLIRNGGSEFRLGGELGPLDRLLDPDASLPWSVDVRAISNGLRVTARGALARSWRQLECQVRVEAAGSDLSAIVAALPQPLPSVRDASVSVSLHKIGRSPIEVAGVDVHVSGLAVPSVWPGVTFGRVDIVAPGLASPLRANADVTLNGMVVHLSGSVASLAAALSAAQPAEPVAFDLNAEAQGTIATLKGTLRRPVSLSGLQASLALRAGYLAALSPLVGRPLPDLKQVGVDADIEGDLAAGSQLALHKVKLSTPEGDFAGDLTVVAGARPSVRGTLNSAQFDLDDLLAVLNAAAAPPAPAAAPGAAFGAPAESQPPALDGVFSRVPWDFSPLGRADVDLHLAVAGMQVSGISYANIATHLVVQNGRLALDPFGVDAPGGRVEGRLQVDSQAAMPALALKLHAGALPLAVLAAATGTPDAFGGTAYIDADLTAAGRSPHDVAASLDGHVGLAVTDGDVDNAALAGLLGEVLKVARVPESMLGGVGRTRLRCLAARLDIGHGEAAIATLTADSSRLLLEAGGGANLGAETLALRLRPLVRTGPGIVLPVRVGGTLRAPKVAMDADLSAKGAGALATLLSGEKPGDPCPAALAIARGAVPPAPVAPAGKPAKPIDVLRNVLH